jgi:ribosomal protein S18 acetylase RimI-like enzyme
MISIRLANPNDAPLLAVLRYEFRSAIARDIENKNEFIARCEKWMREHLQQTSWRCWVAEADQTIVGALWLQLIEKIPNPTSEPELHGYITNVFVNAAVRGQGIGSRLLDEAIEFCKKQPVHAVILWPSERSRSLYERHGFAVRSDLLELIVSKSSLN